MHDVDTLLVAAINGAQKAISDAGWQQIFSALAFSADRSRSNLPPIFEVHDGLGTPDFRFWAEARPKGTQAYIVPAARISTTGLPTQVEAGFRGGGMAAGVVVVEPKRAYVLATSMETRPVFQTSGTELYQFIAASPLKAAYVTALVPKLGLGSDAGLQRHFESIAEGEALNELLGIFRSVAKQVDTIDKAWVRFLGKIPYADRTRTVVTAAPAGDVASPETDLPAAEAELKRAVEMALALIENDADMKSWADFFQRILGKLSRDLSTPPEAVRVSAKPGSMQTPTAESIMAVLGLPKEALRLMICAKEVEAIFAGMGSWNDTPYAPGAESGRLYRAAHRAYLTAVNQSAQA